MQKFVLITFVVLVCLPAFLLAGRKAGNRKPAAAAGTMLLSPTDVTTPRDCGPWMETPCAPPTGTVCGLGTKVWNRTGNNCSVKEKVFKCKIPCDDSVAKQQCKYVKSAWSACDPTTNVKSRLLTLKVKRRGASQTDSSCEQTKTMTKSCVASETTTNKRGRTQRRGE